MPIISKLAHYQEMKGFLVLRDAEMDAKGAAISVRQSILRAFSVSIPEDDTFVKNEEAPYLDIHCFRAGVQIRRIATVH